MKLKELARERGTNLKQVAEKCGIPPTTLYAISRGDTNFDNVGIGTAIKVANALGMTVEELYTGKKAQLSAYSRPLDDDELSLISDYRDSSKEGRKAIEATARAMSRM